jgi:hypothetical protein
VIRKNGIEVHYMHVRKGHDETHLRILRKTKKERVGTWR